MSTGHSRNSASRPRCPATRPCRRPTAPAIPTSPSPSRPAPCRPTPPRKRTSRHASCSSNACWPCNTAWRPKSLALRIGQPADRRARSAAGPPRDLSHVLALVGCRWSITPCCTGDLRRFSAGRCMPASNPNPRSLRNFPMQANGAEMLRTRVLPGDRARDRGVRPRARRGADRGAARAARSRRRGACKRPWRKLRAAVLGGFELGTEANSSYPDRYRDPRGEVMWKRVSDLVRQRERRTA